MALCPKCKTDNEETRLTCFRCGMILPKIGTLPTTAQSEVNVIIDDNLEAEEIVKASDCIFLTHLQEFKDAIISQQTDESNYQTQLDNIKQETKYILDLLNSFSEEEKKWMQNGLIKIEESYNKFQDSFDQFSLYFDDKNSSHLDEGLSLAVQASKLLLNGINESQEELEIEENKLKESESEISDKEDA